VLPFFLLIHCFFSLSNFVIPSKSLKMICFGFQTFKSSSKRNSNLLLTKILYGWLV
jgi:hypothetical protein